MDNGAYAKYKQENPDVYTPLSTYEYLDNYVHTLTNAEIVVCAVAVVLAVFALFKILKKIANKRVEHDQEKSGDGHE
jgi:ammonia channel protein AmtB